MPEEQPTAEQHTAEEQAVPDEQQPTPETATPPHGDPVTDSGAAAPTAVSPEAPADAASFERQLAERTADLQRLQAEYVNYRRRVERDRDVVRESAVASVLAELLPVLDEIHLARQHGDLEGPFKAIAENLEAALAKVGLSRYGEAGEPFDPQVHEALMQTADAGVSEPTATQILQPGYRLTVGSGERVLRPARVAVTTPE